MKKNKVLNYFCSFSEADKKLFTPGPLLTSQTVKAAMLRDLGSRDSEFIETIKIFREGLLKVAGNLTYQISITMTSLF